jgi:adenylate cyclase
MADRDTDLASTHYSPFFLGDVRIDPSALRIERNGLSQHVEARVMEVLMALAREPGRVVSRLELEREVWSGRIVTDDAVTNAVGKLRKALHDSSRQPRVIETIAKSGYRLMIEPVTDVSESPQALTALDGRSSSRPLLQVTLLITILCVVAIWVWTAWEEQTTALLRDDAVASIAVIPFEVIGEDRSQAYFAEGITLDLITELSRMPGLLVIAPGTMSYDRERGANDRAIAAELDVRYLIRGGVQRIGDRIRINVRLLEAERGQTLWAERFVGETRRLFQIQDEVVESIANALPIRLALSEHVLKRRGATESIAAYDEFLRGRERYGRLTPEDNRMAQPHFEWAIVLDPGFARAHAGLALTWSRLAIDGWTEDPQGALSKAAQFAEEAAEIDPSLPQVHFVRAQVELFRGRHANAAEAVAAALDLDPNYADAYALQAWILQLRRPTRPGRVCAPGSPQAQSPRLCPLS